MKQFKDMNQAEKDERSIKEMFKRKEAAEAKGKTYKPRMTGNMERLMEEQPEHFAWMTQDNVATKTVKKVEVDKVEHSLRVAKEFAEYQQGLLLKIGDENRVMKELLEGEDGALLNRLRMDYRRQVKALEFRLKDEEKRHSILKNVYFYSSERERALRDEVEELRKELGRS